MRIIFMFMVLLMAHWNPIVAQCSDAGVCSVGSHTAQQRHLVGVSSSNGMSGSPDDLVFHSIQFEGTFELFSQSTVSIHLPWSRTSGPLGVASGVGDAIVLWQQSLWKESDDEFSLQLGAKIASGGVNAGGLPQSYQPGLGTNDLLLGASYSTAPWNFALGYQLSSGRSNNSVNRLKRGDDVMLRIGYTTSFDELVVGLESLMIQRLQESSVVDPNIPGNATFINVANSDQLQVNILATASMFISQDINLRGAVAVPLLKRNVNIDGLKRSLTIAVGFQLPI